MADNTNILTFTDGTPRSSMKIKAYITDPEIVFVANLTKADAPALAASFECDFCLSASPQAQDMSAEVKALKVLACPFLQKKGEKNVTTVSCLANYLVRECMRQVPSICSQLT